MYIILCERILRDEYTTSILVIIDTSTTTILLLVYSLVVSTHSCMNYIYIYTTSIDNS